MSYPSQVVAGSWSSKYTVQRQDKYGNPVTSNHTTINLSSSSDGANKRFSETAGGPAVTSVTIADGSDSKDFYYYDEKAGTWTISLSAAGLTGDSQGLTVSAAAAANISKVSGNNQSGDIGETLASDFVVKVTDSYGNPVIGATVDWVITETPPSATGHRLSADRTSTDSNGEARSRLTLGDTSGEYKAQATCAPLSESPITFTARATVEEAENLIKFSGDCQAGEIQKALADPFVVKVTDDNGKGIKGVVVSWVIVEFPVDSIGETLSEEISITDSEGKARTVLTIGDKAGLYTVSASAEGLVGSPLIFTAITGKSYFIKANSFLYFSIPYKPFNSKIEFILNELGPYDPARWRLFRYENGSFNEYPNVSDFAPGLGYWLITAEDREIFVEGEEVHGDVVVTLEPGWNQIGCPFTCSVSWEDIKARNSHLFDNYLVPDILWGYDWVHGEYVMREEMQPWQGYWVYNGSESNIDLIIPYR